MTLDAFLDLFDNVRKSGKGFMARCPAHEDRQASLSIGEGDDGKILVTCMAGCATDDVLATKGLTTADLFSDSKHEHSANGNPWWGRIETEYDYQDENGDVLFQCVRCKNPKDFRQRHWVAGKWVNDIKGVRRVPYHLPEVIAATKAHRAVLLPEGEKDADNLRKIGFTASTNPMGAKSWDDAYAPYFEGAAVVVILVDADGPGRKAGSAKARSFHGCGIPAKVLDLYPLKTDGSDVSDWIIEHGDDAAEDLKRLIRRAPRWNPSMAVEDRPLPIVTAKAFAAAVPEYDHDRDYLGPFLHGGLRVHVLGAIGHGKTTFLHEALGCALRAEDFLGMEGKPGLRGLLVDLEMPPELLGVAMRDARLDGLDNLSVMHLPDGMRVDVSEEDRKLLERAIEGFHIVIIDPFYGLVDNELQYETVRTVNSLLNGMRARHPELCMVIGYHEQERKRNEKAGRSTIGDASGFKAFQRPADIIVNFQRVGGDRSRLHWNKNRSPMKRPHGPLGAEGDSWPIEWERGVGFVRVESVNASAAIFAAIEGHEEGLTVDQVCDLTGKRRSTVELYLRQLREDGRIESLGSKGGRGHRAVYVVSRQEECPFDE